MSHENDEVTKVRTGRRSDGRFFGFAERNSKTWAETKSGRQDLNLRPVAAATALCECIKVVATTAGLVIPFFRYRRAARWKRFAMNHEPRHPVLRCF